MKPASWILEAIEQAAIERVYEQLDIEADLSMDPGYRDDLPLRWFLFADDGRDDHITVWNEDDLLQGIASNMALDEDGGADYRDRAAARLRVFADRVAALPAPQGPTPPSDDEPEVLREFGANLRQALREASSSLGPGRRRW